MKNVKKITRLRLEDTHSDEYIFLGLVSSEPDYKLSLLLNTLFRISLKHTDPVKVDNDRADCVFSRYASSEDHSSSFYSLISNRCEKEYLIKKLRNVDYIFISHNPGKERDAEKLSADLRTKGSITAVFRIDPETLKDKNIQYLIH
ncbi:MAG TPA: IPExxxVDY family protein [Bacteroidales bacterium]|nr:IPExxxVDY family protein [Bacteroidales bacterium]